MIDLKRFFTIRAIPAIISARIGQAKATMVPTSTDLRDRVDKLLNWLGYERPNWVTSTELGTVQGYWHSLRLAMTEMNVIGSFGLLRPRSEPHHDRQFLPFVFVATALDDEAAIRVHRKVWSQGVVPFLLVVTPTKVWSCNAAAFNSANWPRVARSLPWLEGEPDFEALSHLKAYRLRSSLEINQFDSGQPDRVDNQLLTALQELSTALVTPAKDSLNPAVANRLLGSFLHLFFLADRGVISQKWLLQRGHGAIQLNDGNANWPLSDLWRLFDDLDEIFNGRIFALARSDRKAISESHVRLIRQVMKHGSSIVGGGVQTSFIDIDLGVLRTETLSAVYEMFFDNHGRDKKSEEGAFYTPPYLVDYVLNQVEEISSIDRAKRLIDCTAGSGLFLVGAFRRIIERYLVEKQLTEIDLRTARKLLTKSIYGIERNAEAATVASFSLFLTMLDYVPSREWPAKGASHKRSIFPDLIDRNLLVRDLFSKEAPPSDFPKLFDFAVGNPPWQAIAKIGDLAVERIEDEERNLHGRVDRNRAAELFFWTAYDEYLKPGGTFGMLLSAKSFLSPGANHFPKAFVDSVGVSGIANLTHMRRKLFSGAEHPAVAVFGVKRAPSPNEQVWVYYPLLSSLPLASDRQPWCIVHDNAEVERHRRGDLNRTEALFRALMLRPLDRQIAVYLDDLCVDDRASTLSRLCDNLGLETGRGGSPADTALPSSKILGADENKHNYYRRQLSIEADLFHHADYDFSDQDIRRCSQGFRGRFSGNIVAIPRSLAHIEFIERPFAFNSSLNAINWPSGTERSSKKHVRLLRALARYLGSGFARYASALYGRMWIVDRRRMELNDLFRLPIPFTGLDDGRVDTILSASDAQLDETIVAMLKFSNRFENAFLEYQDFRSKYENGILPPNANFPPTATDIDSYLSALRSELTKSLTAPWRVTTRKQIEKEKGVGVVEIVFDRGNPNTSQEPIALEPFLKQFELSGQSVWIDSLQMSYLKNQKRLLLLKPLAHSKWTLERATAESGKILSLVMTGAKAAA